MFVQHSVQIECPIEAVSSALAKDPRRWFPRLQSPSDAAIGPRVAGFGLLKKVAVKVGEPVTVGSWTEVPVRWQATSIKLLFPVMVGKVQLAPADGRVTRLTVSGTYQPPPGRGGEQLDEVMHKVAEATVRELAESIAKRLEATSADALRGAD